MGIDVYASWAEMTEDEEKARYTGFSIEAGDVGYLREAYHGGPYATQTLVPEAFGDFSDEEWKEGGASVPAETLRKRLPRALFATLLRHATVYKDQTARWVLHEMGVEAAVGPGDGDPAVVKAEDVPTALLACFQEIGKIKEGNGGQHEHDVPAHLKDEQIVTMLSRDLPWLRAYVDFVDLCARKEKETGQPCRIKASY
jgi:hypothetical protein